MHLALDEARQAAREDEVPVGAVLVAADGRLLARAHNRPVALHDPTAHAEILALRAAGAASGNYRLGGGVLVVTLNPAPCAPRPWSMPGSPGWSTARPTGWPVP